MKEKIYKYLLEKDARVSTEEILEQFFRIYGKQPENRNLIIDSILKDDDRFVKDVDGKWSAKKSSSGDSFSDRIFTIVEFEKMKVEKKFELPFMVGMLQIKNQKIVYKQIFELEIPFNIDEQYKRLIAKKKNILNVTRKLNVEISEIYQRLRQSILISFLLTNVNQWLNNFANQNLGFETELELISLKTLAKNLFPKMKIQELTDILEVFHLPYTVPMDIYSRLDMTADAAMLIFTALKKIDITGMNALKSFLEKSANWVNFSRYNFNREFINHLPESPGCYLMKNKIGQVFYVGKSKNLKSRVASYFLNRVDIDGKGKFILENVSDIEYKIVGSELEALLLENRYLHNYKPELNTQIMIHSINQEKYQNQKLIFFLPAVLAEFVDIYFLSGIQNCEVVEVKRKYSDLFQIQKYVDNFFKNDQKRKNISSDQIEIIWRWLELNRDFVNLIDVNECRNPKICAARIGDYLKDKDLFTDK